MVEGLFELSESPLDSKELTRAERGRMRIERRIAYGMHPLGRNLRLHNGAANGREGSGLRCGSCKFRTLYRYHGRTYPKCDYGDGIRHAHSEQSDVRAWWPACTDYQEETDVP